MSDAPPCRALEAGYAPFILRGFRNRVHARKRRAGGRSCYELWYIAGGPCRIGSTRRTTPTPLTLFFAPGDPTPLDVPASCDVLGLDFDLVDRPRRWQQNTRVAIPLTPSLQPSPQEVWGSDLPLRVPDPLLEGCRQMLTFCCESWWAGAMARLRANARLAEWLATFVQHIARPDMPEADPWLHRCLETARAGLGHGMTVTELAAASGLSRWTLAARLRSHGYPAPRELFLFLRMERARAMLADPAYALHEVARVCGYRSQAAFTRQFGSYHGRSPLTWRRENAAGRT